MNELFLDRRIITGDIDIDIPNCVLIDLAMGNNLINPENYPHHYLLRYMLEKKEAINKINLSLDNISKGDKTIINYYAPKIAAFVNPDKNTLWSLGGLFTAFKHMLFFDSNKIEPDLISSKINIGPKTMTNLYSYNACMLYKICKNYKINTRPTMTIDQMYLCIKYLFDIKNIKIPKCVEDYYPNTDEKKLISIFTELPCNLDDTVKFKGITFDKLIPHYDKISNINNLISRIKPNSHEESIIIFALKYGIDITYSNNPLKELDKLLELKEEKKEYTPFDPKFAVLYKRNPKWFSLKNNYSSILSMIYSNKSLYSFLESESIPSEEMKFINIAVKKNNVDSKQFANDKDLREVLKTALFQTRINETFYLGCHPNVNNNVTPIELDNIDEDDVDINCLISYGSIEYEKLTVYKTSELSAHFNANKNFTNPLNPQENFSSDAIKKLKHICKNIVETNDRKILENKRKEYKISGNTVLSKMMTSKNPAFAIIQSNSRESNNFQDSPQKTEFRSLLLAIENVEKETILLSFQAEELRKIYKNSDSKQNKIIKDVLIKLLEMGMYMRGWKVSCDTFPIESVKTVTPLERQNEVNDYTNHSIHIFKESLDLLPDLIKSKIKLLPLVCYQKSGSKIEFKKSLSTSDGLTISDRISIIIGGDLNNNPASCIRLSSNWIVSSAYYYLFTVCEIKLFDISKLSKIS
jgi:hypothetical protein